MNLLVIQANLILINTDLSDIDMNRIQKTDLDIHLREQKLEIKKFLKCVEIYIDSKLTWEKQINSFEIKK